MFALNICLAVNLIILFIAFFFRKNNTLPNKVLALILLDTAISFAGNATITGGFFREFPYLFFLSWCTSSYFGPLFFTYTCLLTGAHIRLRHPIWISGFAISLFGLSFPLNYSMLPARERSAFVMSLLSEPLPWEMTVINIFCMLTILTSMGASAFKIVQYKTRVVTTLSSLDKTKLTFITQFVILGTILTVATTLLYLTLPQYQVEYLYLPCLITCIYFFILFYTFRHHAIFTAETYDRFLQDTLPASEDMTVKKEDEKSIPQTKLETLAQHIEAHLIRSGIYTNPDLSIAMLARDMQSPTQEISAAIKNVMNKTFFDLINEKRVEKAKELLETKINEMTIEAIAYEAGFNSRASFYRAFKKCTSLTPSSYIDQFRRG